MVKVASPLIYTQGKELLCATQNLVGVFSCFSRKFKTLLVFLEKIK